MITNLRRAFPISAILYLTLILVIGIILSSYYNRESSYTGCCDSSYRFQYNDAGYLDKVSKWKKLGPKTYVFSAYLDDRKSNSTWVTVLGFGEKNELPLHGTLVFHNGARINLKATDKMAKLSRDAKYSKDCLGPYAFSWVLPSKIGNPKKLNAVVVQHVGEHKDSHAEAKIPITFPVYSNKTFGVCIDSPLFGNVKPISIVENFEVNRILGAEWFTIYVYDADENVMMLLQEYITEGMAEVVQQWGTGIPKSVHYYGQRLSINECIYRNMFRVKYLVYTDLDEFIIPRKSISWLSMMLDLEKRDYGTYLFKNVFFPSTKRNKCPLMNISCNGSRTYLDSPKFLSHIYRSRKVYPSRVRSKYILKPLFANRIGVHQVLEHFSNYHTYVVPTEIALLHHYRSFREENIPVSLKNELHESNLLLDERTSVFRRNVVSAVEERLCKNLPILNL